VAVDPELVAAGLRLHQGGQFEQAQAVYRQALADYPNDPDVLSLLGAVCINLRQWDDAERHLDAALRLAPDHFAAHDNRGVLLARQNRFTEAVVSFQNAVELNPQSAATWQNLAAALVRTGEADRAIDALRQVIRLDPNALRAHQELVPLLAARNCQAEAAQHQQAIVGLKPDDPRAHFDWATLLVESGRFDEAMLEYRETLRLDPKSTGAYVNLANLVGRQGKFDEAVQLFDRAIELSPDFAAAYANLASVLTRQGRLAEAEVALATAIRLKPGLSEAHNNLGIVHGERAEFAQAADSYRRALALKPDDPEIIYNLGIALLKQQEVGEAIAHFERAIAMRPDYGEAHHNRSAALLLSNDYGQGLAEYEWRFRSRDFPPARFRWPRWDGSSLDGKTIVLCAEQGLGDTIQFVRYAPMVRQRGARVIVECQAPLHAILARTQGIDAWMSPADSPPTADCCAPLMSLPYLLGTTYATIPAEIPYVFADPERVTHWRERVGEIDGYKVGIVWQGNNQCPGDSWRSIPLRDFAPLAAVAGVRLVNLQKGAGIEQLDALRESWRVVDFGPQLDTAAGAFMDTAAVMQNLDLVITCDTAAAHLAGAMGLPVWVALPFVPDWRWGLARADTPWYPSMRLFRQSRWGQWRDLFEGIAQELASSMTR
jgi:tetratricopeptide (TPR) repeat protein